MHIFSSSLKQRFSFEIPARNRSWEIIPKNSNLGGSPGGDPLSVPGIIQYEGQFQDCPLLLRATTPERTLVDILDPVDRRPRKPQGGKVAASSLGTDATPGDGGEESIPWPPPAFKACWETLSSGALDLNFDELLQYLDCQPRSKATIAKVRFFFTIFQDLFGLKEKDLRKLSNLPKEPHHWIQATTGTLFLRLKLIVPNCLIPEGFTAINSAAIDRNDRLKDIVHLKDIDLGHELKERFGKFNIVKFRSGQEGIIKAILEGRDAMAILPTGSGKSLTYQLPSTMLQGPTLVISPLLSLMKDQVREAQEMGLVAYSYKNKIKKEEIELIGEEIETGTLNLLFVSPESWPRLLDYWPHLASKVAQIVVDEAHLLNSWGQDFRFEFQNLGKLRNKFKNAPILALTATATYRARQMIAKHLNLNNGFEIQVGPVNRPNLYLQQLKAENGFESKFKALMTFLKPRINTPGIVYCSTRKDTEKLTEKLRIELYYDKFISPCLSAEDKEIIRERIRPYHSGLDRDDLEATHQAFLSQDCMLIIATVAFGMGINKKNIRYVVHFGPPPSLENYVQEIGRAGRDSFWSDCLLIHSREDWFIWRMRLSKRKRDAKKLETELSRSEREKRKERIDRQLVELGEMERLANGEQCSHRLIEAHFLEKAGDKQQLKDCGISCDHCRTPSKHRQQVDDEEAWLEPPPSYETDID